MEPSCGDSAGSKPTKALARPTIADPARGDCLPLSAAAVVAPLVAPAAVAVVPLSSSESPQAASSGPASATADAASPPRTSRSRRDSALPFDVLDPSDDSVLISIANEDDVARSTVSLLAAGVLGATIVGLAIAAPGFRVSGVQTAMIDRGTTFGLLALLLIVLFGLAGIVVSWIAGAFFRPGRL